MNELIKEIDGLPENLQEAIKKDVESRVLKPVQIYKEQCVSESEYLDYIDEKIKLANKNISDLLVEASNDKIERYWEQISKLYVFFTEGKKALINLKDECLRHGKPEEEHGNKCTPNEPSTDRAKKAFKKAINKGFITKVNDGYRIRQERGEKAKLAYWLKMIYSPDGYKPIPFKQLEILFDEKRLDSALSKVLESKHEQKWRKEIERLI